jgi:Winged helix-turn helix
VGAPVARTAALAQRQLGFVDRTPWRSEVLRPLGLVTDQTAQQRAQDTHPHPDPVRPLRRRFRRQGMLGLLPATVEVGIRTSVGGIPEAVRRELDRLKALDDGFPSREVARILSCTFGTPCDDRTVKRLWQHSAASCPGHLGRWDSHAPPERDPARLQGVQLSSRGWEKVSISRVLHVSRPTVDAWIRRFEAEPFAGLVDKSRAPQAPVRKSWLPRMVQGYHPQKAHPEAGACRIWRLLARSDVSVRTVGRVRALNRLVYDDIPHVRRQGVKPAPGPPPDQARYRHPYGCIAGRRLDVALDGGRWWSRISLEGDSRTMLAGMVAPTDATRVARMLLYTACLHDGAPASLVSDGGGASTSADFEAVCARLQSRHEASISTQGERDQHWMETPCNIQRRLSDYQFSLARTPAELEPRHQAFIQRYNTTAHQGLRTAHRSPAIPVEALGTARGRVYTPEELARACAQAVVPRPTTRQGCVTRHSDHCYVEAGRPRPQGLRWVAGEHLRAVHEHVVLAESRCRDDGRDHTVPDSREGVFDPTRFAARQGRLIPLTPQDPLVVYRPKSPRRRGPHLAPPPPRLLFEVVATGEGRLPGAPVSRRS